MERGEKGVHPAVWREESRKLSLGSISTQPRRREGSLQQIQGLFEAGSWKSADGGRAIAEAGLCSRASGKH